MPNEEIYNSSKKTVSCNSYKHAEDIDKEIWQWFCHQRDIGFSPNSKEVKKCDNYIFYRYFKFIMTHFCYIVFIYFSNCDSCTKFGFGYYGFIEFICGDRVKFLILFVLFWQVNIIEDLMFQVRQKGFEVYRSNGHIGMTCSYSWYRRWCKKFGIHLRHINDETLLEWVLTQFDLNRNVTHSNLQNQMLSLVKGGNHNFKVRNILMVCYMFTQFYLVLRTMYKIHISRLSIILTLHSITGGTNVYKISEVECTKFYWLKI